MTLAQAQPIATGVLTQLIVDAVRLQATCPAPTRELPPPSPPAPITANSLCPYSRRRWPESARHSVHRFEPARLAIAARRLALLNASGDWPLLPRSYAAANRTSAPPVLLLAPGAPVELALIRPVGDTFIDDLVGSNGDSYYNALAQAVNGLFKTGVIYRRGPCKSREAVELATLECGSMGSTAMVVGFK